MNKKILEFDTNVSEKAGVIGDSFNVDTMWCLANKITYMYWSLQDTQLALNLVVVIVFPGKLVSAFSWEQIRCFVWFSVADAVWAGCSAK